MTFWPTCVFCGGPAIGEATVVRNARKPPGHPGRWHKLGVACDTCAESSEVDLSYDPWRPTDPRTPTEPPASAEGGV